jgi:hypothetical protein
MGQSLQHFKPFRPWTTSLTNKDRDVFFDVCNLGASKPEFYSPKSSLLLAIDKLVFSQRAKAPGSLLEFNVDSERSLLIVSATW